MDETRTGGIGIGRVRAVVFSVEKCEYCCGQGARGIAMNGRDGIGTGRGGFSVGRKDHCLGQNCLLGKKIENVRTLKC